MQTSKQFDLPGLKLLLDEMGKTLAARKEWAEIAVFGGAALLLQFEDRASTRDIDYLPVSGATEALSAIAAEVGFRHGLDDGWFNDAVAMFVEDERDDTLHGTYPRFANEGGLRVFVASPRYILAMKLKIMRSSSESHDVHDVWNLLGHCGIESAAEAEALVKKFFPGFEVPRRNSAILQDLVEARSAGATYDPMMGW